MRSRSDDLEFWSRVNVLDVRDCWHWNGTKQNRYGTFHVSSTGEQMSAHRYAWSWAYGSIAVGMLVLHCCDNTSCVNPRHLRLGTHEDNNADKAIVSRVRSLLAHGEIQEREAAEFMARVIDEEPAAHGAFAAAVRKLRVKAGLNQKELARLLGVSQAAVCMWESGTNGASMTRLTSIAKALNVDLAELLA